MHRTIDWIAPIVLTACLVAGCSSAGEQPVSAPSSVPAPSTRPLPTASGPTGSPVSTEKPATTPVPPPVSGDVNSAVPSKSAESKPPVGLDETANPKSDVEVSLKSVTSIEAKGRGPGEVSGPALRVRVEVKNDSDASIGLDSTVVNLTAADGSPGSMMTGPPADPLSGRLRPGRTKTGTYVFAVDKDQRNPVTVEVSIDPDHPSVEFEGNP